MKAVRSTGQFRRDLRRTQLRKRDRVKLEIVIDMLQQGQQLPPALRDHTLKGEWQGWRECHIAPDWLLIYRVSASEIELTRIGSHSELFG